MDNLQNIAPVKECQLPKFDDTDGDLFYGGSRHFYDAYWETDESCKPYLMASMLTQVGVVLGRRACVSIGRKPSNRRRIYPNFYNAIVGDTSIARKTTCISQSVYDLRETDDMGDILFTEVISSIEGLIDEMSRDPEGDPLKLEDGDFPEGRRALVHLDEMKTLFVSNNRSATSTIIPRLTEAYNPPRELSVRTRTNAVKAPYPVINILAGTTGDWLQDSVSAGDVRGGFINRFGFWNYEFVGAKPEPLDPREKPLLMWYAILKSLRERLEFRNFVLSDETWEVYESEYMEHRQHQWESRKTIEASASAREMVHTFKISLAYAALTNDLDDNTISIDAWNTARRVAVYLSDVAKYLFADIGADVREKQEKIFLEKLSELGNDTTRRNLRAKIGGGVMNSEIFEKILVSLELSEVIQVLEGRPQRIVRISE